MIERYFLPVLENDHRLGNQDGLLRWGPLWF